MPEESGPQSLEEWVYKMHRENWLHRRRPGFRLGEASPLIASNHLIEEAVEFQAEVIGNNHAAAVDELANVLGVVVHAAHMLGVSMHDLSTTCTRQLLDNFAPPKGTP
jgi:NTP pyrophosphatase (non-canonical NTP hydrolase)